MAGRKGLGCSEHTVEKNCGSDIIVLPVPDTINHDLHVFSTPEAGVAFIGDEVREGLGYFPTSRI